LVSALTVPSELILISGDFVALMKYLLLPLKILEFAPITFKMLSQVALLPIILCVILLGKLIVGTLVNHIRFVI
jgi:hypothetical protein